MIGIDITKISRMKRFMEHFEEKALHRFLSEDEIALVKSHKTAAGFWATKEAFAKALGVGIGEECSFFDIKIYKSDRGAPLLALSTNIIQRFNIEEVSVSITHDGEYAVSVVHVKSLDSASTHKIKQF